MLHRSLIRFVLAICAAVGLTAVAGVGVASADSGATVNTTVSQDVVVEASGTVDLEVSQHSESTVDSQTKTDSYESTEDGSPSDSSTAVSYTQTVFSDTSDGGTKAEPGLSESMSMTLEIDSTVSKNDSSAGSANTASGNTASGPVPRVVHNDSFTTSTPVVIKSTPIASLGTQRPLASPSSGLRSDSKPVPVPVGALYEITGTLMGIIVPGSSLLDLILAGGQRLFAGLLSSSTVVFLMVISLLTLMSLFVEYLRRAGFIAAPRGPQISSLQFATLAFMGLNVPTRIFSGSFFSGQARVGDILTITLYKKGGE